jgi:hypothetical protein
MNSVKRVLELGTFTGYSALGMAHALPDSTDSLLVSSRFALLFVFLTVYSFIFVACSLLSGLD